MGRRPRIAVNARFATVAVTGVQRYARELLRALGRLDAVDAVVIVPPGEVVELAALDEVLDRPASDRWSGLRGHLWEQTALAGIVRRTDRELLVSPCNWGPLHLERQLPLFHDVAPLARPRYFERRYVRWARFATPRLVRRAARSVVTCDRVRADLVHLAGADADRVDVVGPGIGPPFTARPIDVGAARSPVCVFVGGHDVRKNLGFLTSFWPEVWRRLGLELHVVARGWSSARRLTGPAAAAAYPDGVTWHVDLDDDGLAALLADALCLLWPSHYEGYGLPLLEAMAVGTPFLSTDTGAARELAIVPEQVLPLRSELWFRQLSRWRSDDPTEIREASAVRARSHTWHRSAEDMVAVIERTCSR